MPTASQSTPPTTPVPIGRRAFILGAAAAAATVAGAAACGGSDDGAGDERATATTTTRPADGLTWKGMNLDTDRELWRPEFVRREIETIRDELHCNAILLLGSDLDRLTESAAIAADNDLHVWFEPRRFDAGAADTLDFVTAVAAAAEELRGEHGDVSLSLGVELTIFMHGLLPGGDWSERATALGTADPAAYNAALAAFLADALTAVRPIFGGQITYSSGVWEDVDWTDFDLVGVDLYRDADNEATYVEDVRSLHRHGKPVVITEFGCCAFQGAERMGGGGFTVIDWSVVPPVLQAGLVRDEGVQARYIDDLLGIFETAQVDGAFVYDFIEPGNPHVADPRHDLDMAGFAVVKTFPSGTELAYDRDGHFEPKEAFATIARHFG